MKIIHITASYKPAYIYGGPIMSVAKLCEALMEQGEKSKEQGARIKEQGTRIKEQGLKSKDGSTMTDEQRMTNNELVVFTTTANGKMELDIEVGKFILVDNVPVKYFKRLTKDHSHFSPALLWHLNKVLRQALYDRKKKVRPKTQNLKLDEQRITNNEQRISTNDLIIHIHAWWNLVSVLTCLIARWYSVPVVLSPRGMLTAYSQSNRNSFSKKLIHGLIGKKLLSYCHIHATSEQEKQDVLKIITPKSITVIPNLVDLGLRSKEQGTKSKEQGTKTKEQRPKSKDQRATSNEQGLTSEGEQQTTNNEQWSTKIERRCLKIIFLSRIEEKKGLEILFEALAQTEFDWCLTIAGSGEENYVDSLKLTVESLKLSGQISWVGQVKNEAKFDLLANHDLLALTSYNENFANVVIESLNVGTAVLLSAHVGLVDYVSANDFGWITTLNIDSIKEKLNDANLDLAKRQKIRAQAPQIVKNDFTDMILAQKYIKLYEKIK